MDENAEGHVGEPTLDGELEDRDRPAALRSTCYALRSAYDSENLVHEAEEGGYWAEVPALPGCVSQGETLDELIANLREAIEGWLAVDLPEPGVGERVLELAL